MQRNQTSNCQYPLDHRKSKSSRKTSTSASLTMPKPLTVWITRDCGKTLQRWEYQTTLPDFWEIWTSQVATGRSSHGTMDWFQIGKGVHQGCILSSCLFNIYAEYIMWNARMDEAKAGIRLPGEIPITSDMQMTPPSWRKAKRNWRASSWKLKRTVKKLA